MTKNNDFAFSAVSRLHNILLTYILAASQVAATGSCGPVSLSQAMPAMAHIQPWTDRV